MGIKIPLLSDPSNIFKLFTGEKTDIIQWDIPRFELNVPFNMRFGPIPFPPVPLYATFGAKLNAFADFSVGFDTRGLAKTGNFLDGLYFGDLQNVTSGPDIDEFGIYLEATVGAIIDLYFVSAGIEGGVKANLNFNWNDLDKDGKIYLDELVDLFNLLPEGGGVPGSCVFDARGAITAFIRAYYDVWLFGGDSLTIASYDLFRFNHSCAAPGLGEVTSGSAQFPDGTLLLYAGDFAGKRGTLYGTDPNEEFEIKEVVEGGQPAVEVTFHYTNRDNDPDSTTRLYKGVNQIFFSGGSGNDKVTIDPAFTKAVILNGGAGDDILIGGGGVDRLSGDEGNDRLVGNGGNDVLIGGAGIDVLIGGAGSDRYSFADGWGSDSVNEAPVAVGDLDTFDFSAVTAALTFNVDNGLQVNGGGNWVHGGTNPAGNQLSVTGIEQLISGSNLADNLLVSGVLGGGTANVWTLTGVDRGHINNVLNYERIENLTGGSQDDRYILDPSDSVSGMVQGAGGTDMLDYVAFGVSTPVIVNRQTQKATGIGNTFDGIDRVLGGSSSHDSLIGQQLNTEWTISGPNQGRV